MAVIEYCRNLLNMPEANSEEFISNPRTPHDSAIMFMPEGNKEALGGTMRLGSRTTVLRPGTIASQLYNHAAQVDERHRHRYEVNPDLVNLLEEKGLIFSGKDTTGQRMEVIELNSKTHPYFVGVQFHPEYKSRPLRPAPVFLGLLQAVQKQKQKRGRGNKL